MTQQLVLPEEELARKAGAIKTLSLGLFITAIAGITFTTINWLFSQDIPILHFLPVAAVVVVVSLLSNWLARTGKVRSAGYLLVIVLLLAVSALNIILGGLGGPMTALYLIPILLADTVIGIGAGFLFATLSVVSYVAITFTGQAGLLPQPALPGITGFTTSPRLISVPVVLFYLVAFLSWFAASRLNQALQNVRQYAGELQTANEKLQASEEELRTSNEELEATNEELRSTEEELRASNEEMEAANEELREAQEQLVRSEKLAVIGQLAGGVGHELRNPLGAIKNAVYYIKGKVAKSELAQKEPRVAEFLDIMDDEINSSNKIINDLLGFSRVGKPALSPARIEMVIDDAIAHTQMPESIELTKKLDTSLPEVEIDTDQVRQVLVNIITNAVQAMPEGGKLTIGARTVDNFLQVEITDTGVGIPEDAIEKVFDPLYTMKAKGIGLGLAVCQSIIERHEGHIGVESNVGKGTTFTVRLPLKAG